MHRFLMFNMRKSGVFLPVFWKSRGEPCSHSQRNRCA